MLDRINTLCLLTIGLTDPITCWFYSIQGYYYYFLSTHILWIRMLHNYGYPGLP